MISNLIARCARNNPPRDRNGIILCLSVFVCSPKPVLANVVFVPNLSWQIVVLHSTERRKLSQEQRAAVFCRFWPFFGRFFRTRPPQGRITFNPIPEIAETLRVPGEPAASTLTVGGDGGSATVATAEGHAAAGRKTHLLQCRFMLKRISLPRQARDKHRESSQKEMRFLAEAAPASTATSVKGSSLELHLNCSGSPTSAAGQVAVEILATADRKAYTAIGACGTRTHLSFAVPFYSH